jgi:hypothetical protein
VPMTRPTGLQIWARLLTGTERESASPWCPRFAPPVCASVLRSILFFAKIARARWHTRPIGRFVPRMVASHSEPRHSEQSLGAVAQGRARPSQCSETNRRGQLRRRAMAALHSLCLFSRMALHRATPLQPHARALCRQCRS